MCCFCGLCDTCLAFDELQRVDALQKLVLQHEAPKPVSCFQRCCLCDCTEDEKDRIPSGIADVPEISNLAGLVLQNYGNNGKGTLLTMKWVQFDREKRMVDIQVYGGSTCCCNTRTQADTGQWTYPNHSCLWKTLSIFGRWCNYSYRFQFSNDWKEADIDILVNGCCLCLMPPCAPPCLRVPKCCLAFRMVQTKDSVSGSQWSRISSTCGGGFKESYVLEAMYDSEGTAITPLVQNLQKGAPETMLLTR